MRIFTPDELAVILTDHKNGKIADLRGADLTCAYLRGADLSRADLSRADLRGADLTCAYLRGANLRGAKINWQSHDLIAEILRSAAVADIEKRKIAGLILVSRDRCWPHFEAMQHDPHFAWAITTLAGYVTKGDDAPKILEDHHGHD